MLISLAFMLSVNLAELPALAAEVETEARALTAQTQVTPALIAGIENLSADSERLSDALRDAAIEQDLPSIFEGIAADARERVAELQAADTGAEREAALANLRVLLEDAILIAPLAAGAAADMAQTRKVALR